MTNFGAFFGKRKCARLGGPKWKTEFSRLSKLDARLSMTERKRETSVTKRDARCQENIGERLYANSVASSCGFPLLVPTDLGCKTKR